MADDIVTVGGPERASRRRPDSEEAIESLFHASYPRLAYTAFAVVDDWDLAEQLAQEAFLRLWRPARRRLLADPKAAPIYLKRTVVNLSRKRGNDINVGGTDLEERLSVLLEPTTATRTIDTNRAWRELQQRRSRAGRNRHATFAAALATGAALAIIVPIWLRHESSAHTSGRHGRSIDVVAHVRKYPGAIVARIPVSGVISLAADGPSLWAVRFYEQVPVSRSYQLVKIDQRTNKVTLAVNLGPKSGPVAASAGTVWLSTGHGRALGQLVRLSPATGRVIATVHLAAGPCDLVTFSAGSLWTACSEGELGTEFVRIDPSTGRATGRAGPMRGLIGSIAAAPGGIWYSFMDSSANGVVRIGHPRFPSITAHIPALPVSYSSSQPLAYGQGFAWVLNSDESVAKTNPVTGRVLRTYTHRTYDPSLDGGLDFLAVGDGSLWFLADGYPFSGVLRVSIATGRPLGAVAEPKSGDCGSTPCSQIYATPGAIWVPTAQWLLRIDPARLPA